MVSQYWNRIEVKRFFTCMRNRSLRIFILICTFYCEANIINLWKNDIPESILAKLDYIMVGFNGMARNLRDGFTYYLRTP